MLKPSVASGGQEAIGLLRQAAREGQPYRLVLTDSHMPGMDGFSLVKHIREDPGLGSTVIMMLTSGDQSADLARCQELGIATYLLKPVKQSELLDAIMLALGVTTAEDEVHRAPRPRHCDRLRPLRILLAEDSLVNQKLVVTLLEREGHTVTAVGNGREALAALRPQEFDLVLMDVQMPELDGLEAAAAIRVRERQTGGHVPVVAMTAHALQGDRERCLEAGMDEYIAKPIHCRQLLETIERALGAPTATEPTAAGPPSDAEAMDWSEVFKASKGDREVIKTIVEAALDESPRLLAAIRDAIAAGDPTALRLAAHTLKGSVKYFGAARAFQLAERLELLGQQRDLAPAEATLADLEAEMERLTGALARY